MENRAPTALFEPLELPCGVILKNRIAKSAMSDSLGDGRGDPSAAQIRLYERWANGGVAVSIVGEVQGNPYAAEKPGNLVLGPGSDVSRFQTLAEKGSARASQLWLQLGHAGAMSHPPISDPRGPSALDLPGLSCAAMDRDELRALPHEFAQTARQAQGLGFGGVQIHAAHGFLLSQFLSPLFNKRTDDYGGPLSNRMRLLREVIDAVRGAVGARFPMALKLNATDQLDGGFKEADALAVIAALDGSGIDLIDISGGTYFPGAKSASDGTQDGPYFLDFANQARALTTTPLMLTGGFKTRKQALEARAKGIDVIGLARALVLNPDLPKHWRNITAQDPAFPSFKAPPEGGITAWYTMRLSALASENETNMELDAAIKAYNDRDAARVHDWNARYRSERSVHIRQF